MGYNDSMHVTGNQGLDQRAIILRAMGGGGTYADSVGLMDFSSPSYSSSGGTLPSNVISSDLIYALMLAQGNVAPATSKPAADTVDKSKLIVDYSVRRDNDDDTHKIVIGDETTEDSASDESSAETVVVKLDDKKDSETSSSESSNKPINPYTAAIGTGVSGGIIAKHTKSSLLEEAARKNKIVDDLRDNHIKVQTAAEEAATKASEEAAAKAAKHSMNQNILDEATAAEAKASRLAAENTPIRARETATQNIIEAEKKLAEAKKARGFWSKLKFWGPPSATAKAVEDAEKALEIAKGTLKTANSDIVKGALGKSTALAAAADSHVSDLTTLRDEISKETDPKKIAKLIAEAKNKAAGNTALIKDLEELAKHKGAITETRTALRTSIDAATATAKSVGAASAEAGAIVASKTAAANVGKAGKLLKLGGSTLKAGVKGNVATTVITESAIAGIEIAETKHLKTRTAVKAGINIGTSLAAGAAGAKLGVVVGAVGGPIGAAVGGVAGFLIGAGGAYVISLGTNKAVDAVVDEKSRVF